MKQIIIFLLLLTSLTAFAHEDTYKAVERSNVHIKIQVGYESAKSRSIIIVDEKGNEMNKEWVYFDEINGILRIQ